MVRRHARRIAVFVVGWLIVIVGIVLIPFPGPGWAIVFAGLSVLSTEFAWAERLRIKVQDWVAGWVHKAQDWRAARKRRRTGAVDDVVVPEIEPAAVPVTDPVRDPAAGDELARRRTLAS